MYLLFIVQGNDQVLSIFDFMSGHLMPTETFHNLKKIDVWMFDHL